MGKELEKQKAFTSHHGLEFSWKRLKVSPVPHSSCNLCPQPMEHWNGRNLEMIPRLFQGGCQYFPLPEADLANQSESLSHRTVLPNTVLQAAPFAILLLSNLLTSCGRKLRTKEKVTFSCSHSYAPGLLVLRPGFFP